MLPGGYGSAHGGRVDSSRRFAFRRSTIALGRLLLSKFAQTFFFLFPLFFQISLALFERVIWFCQNDIPARHEGRMNHHKKKPDQILLATSITAPLTGAGIISQ